MIIPSIENFLKILHFYQLNDFKTVKQKIKKYAKYTSPLEFYKNLNYDYDNDVEGLTYPSDEDAIQISLNSRIDLSKYFNEALFPGSYSFNTNDGYMLKSLMLDWSSTIKTFQDSTDRITNVYRLSSDECDLAIRGFGIDFINSRTLPSLYRRQTFLLNMCELYKIKGSPDSIIKALNIIGLDNIYIQEAWVYPTRDGLKNVEIKWIPVKQDQVFDTEENKYVDANDDLEVDYWDWGSFEDALSTINECHWFYTKQEILNFEYDNADTYIHLPSLTPYFNVKIKYNSVKQNLQLSKLFDKVSEQFGLYITNSEISKDCKLDGFDQDTSLLEIWCGLIYTLISYSDYLRYNSLKKFIEKFYLMDLDLDDISGQNKYFQLIYKIYQYCKSDSFNKSKYDIITKLYSQTAVPLNDVPYNELKHWWISQKHTSVDDTCGSTNIRKIIKPSKIEMCSDDDIYNVNIYWNEEENYGYYDIELYTKNDKWEALEENSKVACNSMHRIIKMLVNGINVEYSTVDELYDKIRIVHYHTQENIPHIFFTKPFNIINYDNNSELNMLFRINDKLIQDNLFKKELFHALYEEKNNNIVGVVTDSDKYENSLENFKNIKFSVTDKDLLYKTYINSLMRYPNCLLKEDKDALFRHSFYTYILEPTYNYIDFLEHDGENLNYINYDKKIPCNFKWNWAVSYGNNINTTYFYLNYEATKWCRICAGKLQNVLDRVVNSDIYNDDYGVPFYESGDVFIKVCKDNLNTDKALYFKLEKDNQLFEDDWNALLHSKKELNNTDTIKNFLTECQLKYTVNGNKITVTTPPSDLYPSSVIEEHEYTLTETKEKIKFYFCDTYIKKHSKLAKEKIVAKISISDCRSIYDNVVDCYNTERVDKYSQNNILLHNLITVQMDPYGDTYSVDYTFEEFLKYLYVNGYTLDVNGNVYKRFNYYLDDNNYLYIKCVDLSDVNRTNKDIINYKWIRVKCSRRWNTCDTKSIYYQLDSNSNYILDVDGERISNYFGIHYNPKLTYNNVYDSERYLSDYSIVNLVELEGIPSDCVNILKRGSEYGCYVKDEYYNNGTIETQYIENSDCRKFVNKVECECNKDKNLLGVVNYGLNQDLLDYINSVLLDYNGTSDQYEDMILRLTSCINDYTERIFGISVNLDIYNNHVFKNRLIKNIINFYKPKRDRMLRLTSGIQIEDYDRVYSYTNNDQDYSNIFLNNTDSRESNYNKKENGLYNRSHIQHQINEYIPFDDLIHISKERLEYDVNNERELIPSTDITIPTAESHTEVDSFLNYSVRIASDIVYPDFYLSGIDDKYTSFYYLNKNGYYYYNIESGSSRYCFRQKEFIILSNCDLDGNYFEELNYVKFKIWCIVPKEKVDSVELKDCLYISNKNITDKPYYDSDGSNMKYQKVDFSNISDLDSYIKYHFIEDYYLNGVFDKCIFQVNESSDSYVKLNLKYIDPVFYFGNFENSEFNGYYYPTEKYGYPCYVNNKGKMISLLDLSDIPNYYLDTFIKDYRYTNCNKFWILTDYKQIPDLSDAIYIAFENKNGKESIFEYNEYGYLTEKTKSFYRFSDVTYGDYTYLRGFYGYNVDTLSEHPEYLNPLDVVKYKYSVPDSYKDIVQRRVSQNILPEKYTPVSYINFYFGYGLCDLYSNNYINIEYKTVDNKGIDYSKNHYVIDDTMYQYGALHVIENQILTFNDNCDSLVKTIIYKARNSDVKTKYLPLNDNKWHIYSIVKDTQKTCFYIDSELVNDEFEYENNVQFISKNCSICEFGLFNITIPEWYLSIIQDYGIFRYRKNICTDYNDSLDGSKTFYGKWLFGNPPYTEGDRVSSHYIDFGGTVHYIQYDPKNPYRTYKWNAICRYFPDDPQEISALWSSKIKNRVYDRELIPTWNSDGTIKSITVGNRMYYDRSVTLIGTENFIREYDKSMLSNGIEYRVPSNFRIDGDVPAWYIKDPNDYKTGEINHNPIHIKTEHKIEDPYPIVKHGEKEAAYFDYDHLTDAVCCGNPSINYAEQFDENTKYVNSLNNFSDSQFESKYGIEPRYYNNYIIEGHNNCLEKPCDEFDHYSMYYDPSSMNLSKEMKENHIYHTEIKLNKNDKISEEYCGSYRVMKNSTTREENDLNYCYGKDTYTNNYTKFVKILHNQIENKLTIDNINDEILLFTRNTIVPVYSSTGYHYWELRKHTFTLVNPNNTVQSLYRGKTKINGVCGEETFKYDYVIKTQKIAYTYIKSNTDIDYENNYKDFINQYQYDICGQKLCNYNVDPDVFLKNNFIRYLEQDVIHDGFVNYFCLKFTGSKVQRYDNINYGGRFYLKDGAVYINYKNNWYGKFLVKTTTNLPHQLNDIVCGIDCVYTKQNLYVKTQDKWVELYYITGNTEINLVNEIFTDGKNNFFINIVYTDPTFEDWSYYMDKKKILQTLRIFRDFNFRNNDNISSGFINQQTVTDFLMIFMFYICTYKVENLCLCQQETCDKELIYKKTK